MCTWGSGGLPEGNFLKEVSLWTPFKNFSRILNTIIGVP
jgi:hypothetical protein